jgi:hypothetical protein
MGKAGLPYARSVQQTHPVPHDMLPDAGLVFDSLLRREKVDALVALATSSTVNVYGFSLSGTQPDSSMMFSFAALVSIRKFKFSFSSTSSNLPLGKRFPHISYGREYQRDVLIC